MPLVKFEFELEFLTPAFIGGADPSTKADFSLKPLKSAMRYWWRQFQDLSDPTVVFQKESRIFGNTHGRSIFSLRLTDRADMHFQHSNDGYRPPANSGRSYLLYSCISRGAQQRGRKEWIPAGGKVGFQMAFLADDFSSIKQALFSLWLVQTFGGLGTRSRRGGGSFLLSLGDSPKEYGTDTNELFEMIAEDLRAALLDSRSGNNYSSLIVPSSPLASGLTSADRYKAISPLNTADDVLDLLGERLRDSRSCFTYSTRGTDPLHRQAQTLHASGARGLYTGPDQIPKCAFGLPLIFNFKRRDAAGRVQREAGTGRVVFEDWQIVLKPADHERRASPLFLSVKRNRGDSRHYANALVLWSPYLPGGEAIEVIKKPKGSSAGTTIGGVSQPAITVLTDFIRSLP